MSTTNESGVVRGAIGYTSAALQDLYAKTSKYHMVKLGVQFYQPLAPLITPVVQKVATVADPWVDSVDVVVTGAWKTVNVKVIDPARKKNPKGEISVIGVATEIHEFAAIELKNRYSALLDLSDYAVDYLLPEETQTVEEKDVPKDVAKVKVQSINEVTSKAQKRALKKLSTKWQDVKVFSSSRLKEIIHIDLAAYIENGLTVSVVWTNENIIPVVKNLYDSASVSTAALRVFVEENLKRLYEAIAKYKVIAQEKFAVAYKYVEQVADSYGVPTLVAKTKEVTFVEVSDYVLVKLSLRKESEQYQVVNKKLGDLLRTLLGLILLHKDIVAKPVAVPVTPNNNNNTVTPAPTPKS